jgi:hypothetical protein
MRRAAVLLLMTGCPEPTCPPSWSVAVGDMDRVVLSVWGAAADDVYLAGGGLGNPGHGALLARWDGQALAEVPVGRDETLWWVWGASADDVWAVGAGGLVLRGAGDGFAPVDAGTSVTLYGVWGAAADDVWIVGEADTLLHWNGVSLARDTSLPVRDATLFKVWGASADDVWVVGERGTLWRRHAGVWEDHAADLDTQTSILTVHGCAADDIYAVGGAHVWHWDGTSWRATQPPPLAGAAGVFCGEREVLVVGLQGAKLRLDRRTGAWADDTLVAPWDADFHGSWIDPDGVPWAVGGDLLAPPSPGPRRGLIARRACQ